MKKKIAVLTSGWALDFVTSMLEGMKEAAAGCNTDLYVFLAYKFYEPNGDPNTTGFAVYDLINYQDYDGIIITPNFFNDDERAEAERKKILKSGVPAVSINKPMEGLSFISAINHDVYRDLISHLIEKHNCKNLAFIGGPFNDSGAKSNYEAFLQALESHNLPAKKEQIFIHGDWSYNWAYDVAQKLLEDPEKIPDGIVCINDLAAMAVERVATEKNISIPKELKVIGFDNIELASTIIPSITTVTGDGDRMGAEAVKVILEGQLRPGLYTDKAAAVKVQFQKLRLNSVSVSTENWKIPNVLPATSVTWKTYSSDTKQWTNFVSIFSIILLTGTILKVTIWQSFLMKMWPGSWRKELKVRTQDLSTEKKCGF